MRLSIGVGLVLIVWASSSVVQAQGVRVQPGGRNGGIPAPPGSREPIQPFSRLFRPRAQTPAIPSVIIGGPAFSSPLISNPTIRCGMTMFSIDPRFDAGIRTPAPQDRMKSAVRAVQPPVCGQPQP